MWKKTLDCLSNRRRSSIPKFGSKLEIKPKSNNSLERDLLYLAGSKPDAILAIVEIEKKETPFGPPMELRYSPQELKEIVPLASVNTVQIGKHFYMFRT